MRATVLDGWRSWGGAVETPTLRQALIPGHFEKVPYNHSELRSIYHIREYDVTKLSHLPANEPTIFLSHDWPIGIAHHGNTGSLLKRKPFFRSEVSLMVRM